MKRGESQQVSTVLLISIAVFLIILVAIWAKGFIEELAQKRERLAEKKLDCQSIDISVIDAYQQGDVAFVVVKNLEREKVEKFSFRITGDETETRENYTILGPSEVRPYSVSFDETFVKTIKEIEVVPWIRVAGAVFIPCSDKHVITKMTKQSLL